MGTAVSVKILKAANPPTIIKGNLILFSWGSEGKVVYFDFDSLDQAQTAWLAAQGLFDSGDRNSAILLLTHQPGYNHSGASTSKPDWIEEKV